MKIIKKIGLNIVYCLIILATIFGVFAEEIPYVQLEDTSGISYLNIFNYNTSIHNNLTELQGGLAPNQYYHLNLYEYNLVTSILSNVSLDYINSTILFSYGYYNASDFDIADYSTTAQADNLYAPVGYGDEWNKTYADTLYTNETDTDTHNTTAEIFNAVDNGTFYLLSNPYNFYNASDFDINDYILSSVLLDYGYYNSSDFDIADYYTSAEILGFSYYNSSDFNIGDYSTTLQANNLYAPIGYGDNWNKTYADTLYTNETDTDTNLTEDNVEEYIFDADNTANLQMTTYNITMGDAILYVNSTCFVVKIDTTYFEVCK